jgi:phosphatidylglycerophosphatase A
MQDSLSGSNEAEALPPVNPGVQPAIIRPSLRFLFSHPAHLIALGFGSGLAPFAPGTAGTLWAWVIFLVVQPWMNDMRWGIAIALSVLIGWWACTVTAKNMRVLDPGSIVWDEVAAFWIVLWLVMPTGFWGQLAAFVLFRFFDMVKPGPIAWADEAFKGFNARGGFGIMLDDLMAAFAAVLVMALWRFL